MKIYRLYVPVQTAPTIRLAFPVVDLALEHNGWQIARYLNIIQFGQNSLPKGVSIKRLWIGLEEKWLRNSKIFMKSFSLFIIHNILKFHHSMFTFLCQLVLKLSAFKKWQLLQFSSYTNKIWKLNWNHYLATKREKI